MAQENLNNKEAIEKLKSIVDQIDIGILCSFNENSDYPHAVPMSRQEVDKEGNIWYICSAESDTYKNLDKSPLVSVLYSDPKNFTFLSINGKVILTRDQQRIDRYWNKMMEGWFEKGKEDPNIRLIKVLPDDAHYWDSDTNIIATLVKMVRNSISGNNESIGKEGDLNI